MGFDGIDDYVSIPPLNNNEVSLCAWFHRLGKGKTNADAVFCGWDSDKNPREGFGIKLSSKARNILEFTLVTQDANGKKTKKIVKYKLSKSKVSRWCYVVGTYKMTTGKQRLYVNGKLVKTTGHPAGNTIVPLESYPDMTMGASVHTAGFFKGIIDDVRLYNRPLSNQEVLNIYNNP